MSDERVNVVITSVLVAVLGGLGLLFNLLMASVTSTITDTREELRFTIHRNVERIEFRISELERELRKASDQK